MSSAAATGETRSYRLTYKHSTLSRTVTRSPSQCTWFIASLMQTSSQNCNKDKLAFICCASRFAFLTMPFGPTGALDTVFQHRHSGIYISCPKVFHMLL
ncbi:hypothetical protein VP01_15295g1 [Puccinia sorghi]|uniref:Uncharacterized protein n=1 Tax=Puccinia sorghi TaxID=27349 RepID=A0A0L6VIK1_9BASI|nr:hypothetical protein VP01_15295g1 [Puccinia sorghi]